MTMQPFHKPNYRIYYNGYEHDVLFTLSCEGLIDEPDCRLGMAGIKRRKQIEEAMKFIGMLYGPRYAPSWEQTKYNADEDSGVRLVFDAIELSFRKFHRKFKRHVIDDSGRERLKSIGFSNALLLSSSCSFCTIWNAFYEDVAIEPVLDAFNKALDDVVDEMENEV